MSILEKLNIEELSDTKLRDEILRTEEQIKILELTEKEYNGYLQLLKAEREKNFNAILPYLEKAVELDPTSQPAKKTLLSVYNALEMTDKYKALKAKL